MNIQFKDLSILVVCLAILGCDKDSDDTGKQGQDGQSDSNQDAGGQNDSNAYSGGQNAISPGPAVPLFEIEPLSCGGVECDALSFFETMTTTSGTGNIAPSADASAPVLEYCCTPSDACSYKLSNETECPDPFSCDGVPCGTDYLTAPGMGDSLTSVFGTPCCSDSGLCSVLPPEETVCPEPDPTDPDCPSMADLLNSYAADASSGTWETPTGAAGDGCCLPDGTCGMLSLGICEPTLGATFGMSAVYDCDGDPIDNTTLTVEDDAGSSIDSDAGAALDAD